MESNIPAQRARSIEHFARVGRIIDDQLDALMPRMMANDFRVDPRDRLELAGPVIAIMRPRQPGGPVRLPFGREAHRGMSSSRRSKSHDLKREAGEPRS